MEPVGYSGCNRFIGQNHPRLYVLPARSVLDSRSLIFVPGQGTQRSPMYASLPT